MKRKFLIFVTTAVSVSALVLSSCTKSSDAVPAEDAELVLATSDSDENNDVENVLNDAMEKISSDGSLLRTETDDCGGTLVKDGTTNRKYKISYNGTCFERTKSGDITIELTKGTNFKEAGAEWTINYINVAINNSTKNRKLVLNGTQYVTNVSGGNKNGLTAAGVSLIHKTTGTMTTSLNDTSTRTLNISRTNTWTNASVTISTENEVDGYKNLVRWGKNKRGFMFYTQITTPIVFNKECGKKPVSGTRVHTILRPIAGDLVTTQILGSNGTCGNQTIEMENKKSGNKKSKTTTIL